MVHTIRTYNMQYNVYTKESKMYKLSTCINLLIGLCTRLIK